MAKAGAEQILKEGMKTMLGLPGKSKLRLTVRLGLKVRLLSRSYSGVIYTPGILRAGVKVSGYP